MDLDAKDFLIKMARENINEVTIVALGPLTNIALVHNAGNLFYVKILPAFGQCRSSKLTKIKAFLLLCIM